MTHAILKGTTVSKAIAFMSCRLGLIAQWREVWRALSGSTDQKALTNLKASGFLEATDQHYAFVRSGMKQAESIDPVAVVKSGR